MRKAVISGHSRGLGYALAEYYLRAGWAVFGLARGRADLRPSENLFQAELDLSDAGLLAQKLSDGLLADFIRDADELLLINNAGTTAPNALLGRQGPSEIVRAVALNVTAPLLLSDYLLSARPDGVHLKIVHIGSGAGRREYAGWSVYGVGKAAFGPPCLVCGGGRASGLFDCLHRPGRGRYRNAEGNPQRRLSGLSVAAAFPRAERRCEAAIRRRYRRQNCRHDRGGRLRQQTVGRCA